MSITNTPIKLRIQAFLGGTYKVFTEDASGNNIDKNDYLAHFGSDDVRITIDPSVAPLGAYIDYPAAHFTGAHSVSNGLLLAGQTHNQPSSATHIDPNFGTSSAWFSGVGSSDLVIDVTLQTVAAATSGSSGSSGSSGGGSFLISSSPSSWTYTFSADPSDGINKSEFKILDSNGVEMSKDVAAQLIAADSSADSLKVTITMSGPGGSSVNMDLYVAGAAGDPSTILYQPEPGYGPVAPMSGPIVAAVPAIQPPAAAAQAFDTFTSADDGASNSPASVAPLDDNAEDGIIGHLQDLLENDICDALTSDIAPEQQLIDDMIALINVDNGADAQFAEDVTDAMEGYIEAAHPALVQSMLAMVEMLHNSNEELVEWSYLKHMRDLVEIRRAALDTCLDDQKTLGLAKVLNRLFAQVGGTTVVSEADLVASPPTGGVTEGDGTNGFSAGQFFVDVNHPDGNGGYITAKIPVTSIRKALLNLAAKRLAAATAFDDARDAAAVDWSEDFKNEFLFEYDSLRTANAQDASFDNTITIGDQLGQSAVYAIASDTSDDVASAEAEYDTAGSTDDDYPTGAKSVMARDASDAELSRVSVGGVFPANSVDQSGASLAGKTFGGGFDELRVQILIKHSLKEVSGNLVER